MNKILLKEFSLTASPLSFFFIAFSLMTLIPGYPILLGSFFVCFGLFQTFQKAREENDILFGAVLPVRKKDIVYGKYLFVCSIQVIAFICMTAFSLLRIFLLNKFNPYRENQMLNGNMTFLGFVFIVFGTFNIAFVGGFFKTAYKIGIPFLSFVISVFIVVIVSEVLWRIPTFTVLNSNYHFSQIIVLVSGAVFYVIGTCLSLVKSYKRFEKLDL